MEFEELLRWILRKVPQILIDNGGHNLLLRQFVLHLHNVIVDQEGLQAERRIKITLQPLMPQYLHLLLYLVDHVVLGEVAQLFDGVGLDLLVHDVHLLVHQPSRFQDFPSLLP